MTKSELIKRIHRNNELNYTEIEAIVSQTLDMITQGLAEDGKVVLSGFGTFEKYYQDGYYGVNPATGAKIFVEGNYKIRFNASKSLKEKLIQNKNV